MDPIRLFISYRRDNTAGYARAIGADLARHFGPGQVFIDVDDIGAGQPFAEVIRRAVGESKVLLVLIGKRWLGERAGALPRLFDAEDFVRLEVAAGLAAGLRVIPVLLDGAAMPTAAQLPDDLKALAGRNALELGHTRYAGDLERLVAALRETLGAPALPTVSPVPSPAASSPAASAWRGVAALAVAAALLVGGWWALRAVPDRPLAVPASAAAPAFVRLAVNGEWEAEVVYDWPNARYLERFVFQGDGESLHGSAAFLRVPRGLLEGRVLADGLQFVTRTRELPGGDEVTRRYRGRWSGDGTLAFVMQTEGGSSTHVPVEFTARRVAPAASAAAR